MIFHIHSSHLLGTNLPHMHSASVDYCFVHIQPGIEVWVHACSYVDILIRLGTYLLWYNYHNALITCTANEMAIHDYLLKLSSYINPPTIRLVHVYYFPKAVDLIFNRH